MNNLILFLNSFLSYFLLFIIMIVLIVAAVIIGVQIRKKKNENERMIAGGEEDQGINT